MASKKPRRQWTPREDWLAAFLFRTPASPQLVHNVSQTWPEPFASLDFAQRRLKRLCQAGWVSRSRYTAASRFGGDYYYKLTLDGFRQCLRSDEARPPTKRFLAPIVEPGGHLAMKARFLSHLTVVAHRRGLRIENDRPENTFSISVGDITIWPDHYLELVGPYGRRFPHFFEFDRSTETQHSDLKLKSTWREKNLVYDGHQSRLGRHNRFRVVPVTSESRQRLRNILNLFAVQTSNPDRQLYVGVYLPDFLAADDALTAPIFADHRTGGIPLVPRHAVALPPKRTPIAHFATLVAQPAMA